MLLVGYPQAAGVPGLRLLLIVVVVSPILEELMFRGGLQTWLYEKPRLRQGVGAGISFANLITSLLFAAFHTITQPWVWAAAVFIPSLVFGWVRDRSGSTAPAIVLHVWYNIGFVFLFVR